MTQIDLNEFKTAWKTEQIVQEKKISNSDMNRFLKISSKSVKHKFIRTLIFDVVLKIVLLILFFLLTVFLHQQVFVFFICLISILLILISIVTQIMIYKKLKGSSQPDQPLLEYLHNFLNFNRKYFFNSLLISALSAPLFFISGSLAYLYIKYEKIPMQSVDDVVVFLTGIFLSFGMSAYIFIKQNNFQVEELQKSLKELLENLDHEKSIRYYKTKKIINFIFYLAVLIFGLSFLFFLIQGTIL